MASVWRVTAIWEQFLGAPGYSKFSFIELAGDAGAVAATAAVRAFFQALPAFLSAGITVQVQREIQEYDQATGVLLGEISASVTPAVVTGTAAGAWSGGSGAFIGWKTGQIWQGRRVQGRTFLVPLAAAYDTNGSLTAGFIAAAEAAGAALIADANSTFAVWAKQFTKPTVPGEKPQQIGGAAFQVQTGVVKDQASQLRSRRH